MAFLFADIGGTNVRFGYTDTKSSNIKFIKSYEVKNYQTIEDSIKHYCSEHKVSAHTLSLCVAAPTNKNSIVFTNNHWRFKKDVISETLGITQMLCINDFTAQALAQIPYFKNGLDREDSDSSGFLKRFNKGQPDEASSVFVIGPGTGLGASTLVKIGNTFKALQAEGGHTHFSPTDKVELDLLIWLKSKFGPVSTENVISGTGLENIYQFLSLNAASPHRNTFKAEEIGSLALRGDPLSIKAVNLMMGALGTATANGVLTTGSFQGVIICGGIIPKLLELFSESPFYDKFTYNKPKYTTLLRNVPIYISKDPYAGLKGCQQALHNKFLKSEINRFSYD